VVIVASCAAGCAKKPEVQAEKSAPREEAVRVANGEDHGMYLTRGGGLDPEYPKAMHEWLGKRVGN